jgi:hypothetical protein
MTNNEPNNYSLNIDPEDLIQIYIRQWVLKWCKSYHPEAFETAETAIRKLYNENKEES